MPATILLVDDEHGFVDTMAKRLTRRGHRILVAYGGEEALSLLEHDHFVDVVVLDVKMPGMDGIEVLERIKTLHPLIEVIMLTGHATVENAITGMKRGAFDYMMKPCEMEELLIKVSEAYDKKSSQEMRIQEARARNIALRMGE